ncbi:hypothetical protein BC833DRAFT_653538 [Globomyces pollinis-pini]|nr:hypothetical protein BC833DRAFT_653538 [Globomyces pollinis-pini]
MKVTIKITRKDVPKKKVICLHGGGMNGVGFSSQLNDYTVNFPDIEFVFLDGPMLLPIELVPEPKDNQRLWMIPYRVNDNIFGMDRYNEALQKSRELLFEHWDSNCIGLIGFSQGGMVLEALNSTRIGKQKLTIVIDGVVRYCMSVVEKISDPKMGSHP